MFPSLTRDDVFRIETPRLWLRWPRLQDAVALATWVGRPEVATKTSTFKVGMSVGELRERLQQVRASNACGRNLSFVMTPQGDDDRVIGMVGVQCQGTDRLELGYHLDPESWGRGLMTEAVRHLCEQVFELAPVAIIAARAQADNRASIRVLEKCGFKVTGAGVHESPIHGEHAVTAFGLSRSRPSALLAAQRRRAAGPKIEHQLVGLV